jgi:hypothetical protein
MFCIFGIKNLTFLPEYSFFDLKKVLREGGEGYLQHARVSV